MMTKGLTEDEAISLMSLGVDFGITQVVDGNWGVHAIIKKGMFVPARRPDRERRLILGSRRPDHSSNSLATKVKSEAAPKRALVMASISRTAPPTTMGTPSASASSTHRRTSL